MKLHITNINGFNASKELRDAQTKVSKAGIELGAYEMGIYTYPVDSDSDVELSKRLDGIISALGFDDIVVLQLPTSNGYKYDSLLMAKILAYHTKLVIYMHGECLEPEYLNLLKSADSIIVNKNVNYHFLKNRGFCSVFLDSNYGHTKKCLMDAIERLCFVENTLLCMRNRVVENEIQVGFGLYDKSGDYTSWVGVTIQSILEHTNSKVCFHILHDSTLSNANKIKLIEIVEKFDDRIQFYTLSDDLFEEYNAQMGNYKVGAMFRVMLPKILGDLNRIIYLDADLLFNRDIQELWDIDINDYCLAAVPDLNVKKGYIWTYPTRGKVIERTKYFNSGVLYMNLENIRKKGDLHIQTIEYLKEHPESDLPDQDALNVIYKDDTLLIDENWNYFAESIRHADERELKNKVYHYVGTLCTVNSQTEMDYLYYKTLLNTPWFNDPYEYLNRSIYKVELQLSLLEKLFTRVSDVNNINIFYGSNECLINEVKPLFHTIHVAEDFESIKNMTDTNKNRVFTIIVDTVADNGKVVRNLQSIGLEYNIDFFNVRCLFKDVQGGYVL